MRRISLPIPLVAVCLLTLGCRDGTEAVEPRRLVAFQVAGVACPSDPVLERFQIVRVDPTTPPLSVEPLIPQTFHVLQGQDERVEIRFQGRGTKGTGTWFLRLRFRPKTLLVPALDVEVTVDQTEADGVLFSARIKPMSPDQTPLPDPFINEKKPVELEFHYAKALEADIADGGDFKIFRQEGDDRLEDATEDFVCTSFENDLLEATIKAELDSFTRYALAIGR